MAFLKGERITMSSRVNIKALATVVRWMKSQGVAFPQRGQQSFLINYAMESLAHSIVQSGYTAVHGHQEALDVLSENGVHMPHDSKPSKEIRTKVVELAQRENKEPSDWEKEQMEEDARKYAKEVLGGKNEEQPSFGPDLDNDEETKAEGKHDQLAGMPVDFDEDDEN